MAAPAPQAPVKRKPEDAATPAHKPYVPDDARIPEFTWSAVIVGAVLGIIFGASSLYLVLKVGLTVSASIPVAVLSITLFRGFTKIFGFRPASILENNIVQTTGSAGESIAFGVGVTMPALMLLGFEMDIGRVMVVSILGGMLGILMMIPLRRAFIVRQHGTLKYPEGTACADVLIVGEEGGSSARTVFVGFGVAALYQFMWQGLKLWKEVPSRTLSWFKGAVPAIEVNPVLLGVGYIIGTKISCIMVAGGVLSAFVLIPGIRLFGDGLLQPLYPAKTPIALMSEEEIWKNYVLYIGAGAVAAGGIISLFQSLPLIFGSMRGALRELRAGSEKLKTARRTDRDMPLWVVFAGSVLLVVAIWATTPLHRAIPWIPELQMNIWAAILIVLFGFLFVTVSSRLTGEIGSSSNPISGMTIATLLLTCTVFLVLGKDHPEDRLTALSVAAVVCIAASNGGTTSQDLKTGYLVGATPKWQQWSILIGSVTSAIAIGAILIALNKAETIYSNRDMPQPRMPIDVSSLTEIGQAPKDNAAYHVWRAAEGNRQEVPPGEYLVDDSGRIRYLVDPGINGVLPGHNVSFTSPKARLMAFITDGILNRNLPWELVLLGVAIAVVLELCGVASLPFAVGVYLPLSSSTPIFVGGLVRWVADWQARRSSGGRPIAETEADMSPGVLLSTGYIAGGAIAGVLIAFLSFSDTIPAILEHWEFRTITTTQIKPVEQAYRDLAKQELEGGSEPLSSADQQDLASLDAAMNRELARVSGRPSGSHARADQMSRLAEDERRLTQAAGVRADDDARKQQLLRNAKILALSYEIADINPELPPGAPLAAGSTIKVPQSNWPALVAFGGLTLLLTMVGLGWVMESR